MARFPKSPTDGQRITVGRNIFEFSQSRRKWTRVEFTDAISANDEVTNIVTSISAANNSILPSSNNTITLGTSEKRFSELYLSGNTIFIGNTTFSESDVFPFDLDVVAETLTIGVDAPSAGFGHKWLWSWNAGQVAYGRLKIDNIEQSTVPLYKQGTYTAFNFAAHELTGQMTQTHKLYLKWIEGAGTQNIPDWVTSTLNVADVSFMNIRGGASTEVQRLVINVPSTIEEPTLTPPTVSYGVSAKTGAYVFSNNAFGDNASLGPLYRGGTYTFQLSANVSGHPFYLTTDDGTNYSSDSYVDEYTNGVTNSRAESGNVVFTVPNDAPDTLYYQCGVHSAMRGEMTIKDLAVERNESNEMVLYFQHDQEGHATPVPIREKPSISDQLCLIFNSQTGKFEPQDMGEYLDQTAQFQTKIQDLVDAKLQSNGYITSTDAVTTVKEQTTYNITLYQQGELTIETGTARWYAPFDLSITDIRPRVASAADEDVGILVKKNGTTEKTITVSSGQVSVSVSNASFSMTEGDYITLDVTSVGTTNKGEDLFVQFTYQKT